MIKYLIGCFWPRNKEKVFYESLVFSSFTKTYSIHPIGLCWKNEVSRIDFNTRPKWKIVQCKKVRTNGTEGEHASKHRHITL